MPPLTPREQQELIRCIQAGDPLPAWCRYSLFEDGPDPELVWNGKTRDVCSTVLPFRVIERMKGQRVEPAGWANMLIWGDNKLVLSSLRNGPLREEINRQGGLKLIYIDPPFDVGTDFSMEIPRWDRQAEAQA